MITRVLLVCCLALATGARAEAPGEWLQLMNRAFVDLAYDGTFSYFTGNDLASLRVVHKVVDGEQRERLVHLNGEAREIVRHGDQVACIVMPGDDLLDIESSIPAGPFARAFVRGYENIGDLYTVRFDGEERVAGRNAKRIEVKPRDDFRFGYRVWLDETNHMLLRSELMDAAGRRLEIFQFSHIVFGEDVEDAALGQMDAEGAMVSHLSLGEPSEPLGVSRVPWQAGWLPQGFIMSAADLRSTPAKLKNVHALVYSDGLAAFSVFIEAMPEAGAAPMHRRVGATVSTSTKLAGDNGEWYLVTLVGEVPDETAKRVLENLQPAA